MKMNMKEFAVFYGGLLLVVGFALGVAFETNSSSGMLQAPRITSITVGNAEASPVMPCEVQKLHMAVEGDTINSIAATWEILPQQLRQKNNLSLKDKVHEGQLLVIPELPQQD